LAFGFGQRESEFNAGPALTDGTYRTNGTYKSH
jgi:hypothetical protein